MENKVKEVVFFDGYCQLCDAFVSFVLPRSQALFFSPIQSEYGHSQLPKDIPDTIVFQSKNQIYYRSSAIIRILAKLGGLWPLIKVFLLVPSVMRDRIYDVVAKNRTLWWPARKTCRLPTAEEKQRFL